MENRPEFLMAWIGIAQVGGTSALINTNLTGHALNHSLNISGSKNLILGTELLDNFKTTNDTIRNIFNVWVEGDSFHKEYNNLNLSLENLSENKPLIDYSVTNDDIALYIYTLSLIHI